MVKKKTTAVREKQPSLLPWRVELGDREDGSDCLVIDGPTGSIAEMTCPEDVEEINAAFIVKAVNSYGLRESTLQGTKDGLDRLLQSKGGLSPDQWQAVHTMKALITQALNT